MKEIQYKIVKEIAVLSASDSGYTKEINLSHGTGESRNMTSAAFPRTVGSAEGYHVERLMKAAALLKALQKESNSGD